MTRNFTIGLTGLLLAAASLGAQATPASSGTVSLADVTFHPNSFDPVRVFLARGIAYRIQFSEPGIQLAMRSYEGKPLPFVLSVNLGPDATGRTDYELSPQVDGEIEFRPLYVEPGRAVRFQLWSVAARIAPTPAMERAAGMELGVIARIGTHGAYSDGGLNYASGGKLFEGCLAIRGGGGAFERLGGCVLGLSREAGGAASEFTFVFVEPRLRLIGPGLRPGVGITGGLAIRIGSRIASATGDPDLDPAGSSQYGFGVYIAAHHRGDRRGGTVVEAFLLLQQLNGRPGATTGVGSSSSTGANALAFRIGLGRFF